MKFETAALQHRSVSIQSAGALFAFHPTTCQITAASTNCREILGSEAGEDIIGQHVRDFLGGDVFHALRNAISLPSITQRRAHIGRHLLNDRPLDVAAFQTGEFAVVELTKADSDPVPNAYDVLKDTLLLQDHIQSAGSRKEAFQNIVMLLRAISGYDCVAACKYKEHRSQIVASAGNALAADETLETTSQMHALLDIDQPCVGIRSMSDLAEFNVTLSGLRCPPQTCMEKLRRMGAVASVTMGILNGDRLWGYLVLMHRAPRAPSHRTKLVLAHLGPAISAQLNAF